ncbi:MAG: metallophosphoesterase [Chlamydiales bacterium]|nr:metallophosphoesterase [Chlamydiales bacterium]
MRIAHISDLHFGKVTLSPLQFFSKRWLGNLNLFFHRKHEYKRELLAPLAGLFKELEVDLVVISGDLTTTSLPEEFEMAVEFIRSLKKEGIEVVAIPGNHDHYTKAAYRQRLFYDYFPAKFSDVPLNLKEHGIAVKELKDGWFLIALDTALATSPISSRGNFSCEIENALNETLGRLPPNSSVILVNHFPFFDVDGPRKALMRSSFLRELLMKNPAIKFYLNGHTHRHAIADLRPSGLPIMLDSGSSSHQKHGAWNLIEIQGNSCEIEPFFWKNSAWQPQEKRRVQL